MLLLVVWFQGIWLPLHGYSLSSTPFWAAILMVPMILGFLVAGPLSGWLSDRYGARFLATLGMLIGAGAFFGLSVLPIDFVYWEMGSLLFVIGCGMGMFAAPNASAVMSSVPAENRGAASGMLATLQNTGQQLSLAIFFTIVIVGLSDHLGGGVVNVLTGSGVPPIDASILSQAISSNPTGALFGAFLGQNPMLDLLEAAATNPAWIPLSPSVQATLLQPHFFATVISPGFGSSIAVAFEVAGGLMLLSALISSMRGETYFYSAPAALGSEPAAPAGGAGAPPGPGSTRRNRWTG
ncbi:MAG: MFS transporter [Thermoplasmata archaeon]